MWCEGREGRDWVGGFGAQRSAVQLTCSAVQLLSDCCRCPCRTSESRQRATSVHCAFLLRYIQIAVFDRYHKACPCYGRRVTAGVLDEMTTQPSLMCADFGDDPQPARRAFRRPNAGKPANGHCSPTIAFPDSPRRARESPFSKSIDLVLIVNMPGTDNFQRCVRKT